MPEGSLIPAMTTQARMDIIRTYSKRNELPGAHDGDVPPVTRVLVYGRHEGCMACRLTKRELDKAVYPYEFVDVDKVPDEAQAVSAVTNHSALPVVVVTFRDNSYASWGGMSVERIKQLTRLAHQMRVAKDAA